MEPSILRLNRRSVSRLIGPLPLRICRGGPTVLAVKVVSQKLEILAMAWRSDIQTLARRQLHPRRDEMQLHSLLSGMLMPDPKDIVSGPLQTGKGIALEGSHHDLLLQFAGLAKAPILLNLSLQTASEHRVTI